MNQLAIEMTQIMTTAFMFVEILKLSGLPSKFAPLVALISGVGLGLLLDVPLAISIISAIASSGAYAGIKASVK